MKTFLEICNWFLITILGPIYICAGIGTLFAAPWPTQLAGIPILAFGLIAIRVGLIESD